MTDAVFSSIDLDRSDARYDSLMKFFLQNNLKFSNIELVSSDDIIFFIY